MALVQALMENAELSQELTTGALESTIVFEEGGPGASDVILGDDGNAYDVASNYEKKYDSMSTEDRKALNAAVKEGGQGIYINTTSGGWQNTADMTAAMATGIDQWMANNANEVATQATKGTREISAKIARANQV